MEQLKKDVWILALEHWTGTVIDIIGVYTNLEQAKRIQREYDLQRQGITLYKATLFTDEGLKDDKKRDRKSPKKSPSKR